MSAVVYPAVAVALLVALVVVIDHNPIAYLGRLLRHEQQVITPVPAPSPEPLTTCVCCPILIPPGGTWCSTRCRNEDDRHDEYDLGDS
ncbi:hypothetical protein ACWF94_03535 [Streptomyces sp. NPDC055078]